MQLNYKVTHPHSVRGYNSFVAKTSKEEFSKYDYSDTVYTNASTKITIKCKYHGEFTQLPSNHTKYGCSKCSDERLSSARRSNTQEFIVKSTLLHGYAFDYSNVIYGDNNAVKVKLHCNNCSSGFEQTPMKHLAGRGCPICRCSNTRKYSNRPTTLYYLKVNDGEAYKIGITIKSDVIKHRYTVSDRAKLELLYSEQFSTGLEAYKREQEILKTYSLYKYTGDSILTGGNTELFNVDILDMDIQEI